MRKPIDHKIDRAGALFHAMGMVMVAFALLLGCSTPSAISPTHLPYISKVIHLPMLEHEAAEQGEPASEPTPVDWSAEPDEAIRLVPADDPMLAEAKIRGIPWPMVYNDGPTRAHKPQTGLVSYYNESQHTATGEHFNPEALTAAHRSLPFGTIVRCIRTDTNSSVVVVINDRGPYVGSRIIDLSRHAAEHLGLIRDGVAPCRIEILAYPLVEAMGPKGNG